MALPSENQINLNISMSLFHDFSALTGEKREAADQEVVDCMWKLQAVHHHMQNVQILEQIQIDHLKQKSKALEEGWLVIGSEPTPLLRFEFEAHLQQVYAALNIGASAVVKILGVKNRTCSFRDLSKELLKKKQKHCGKSEDLILNECVATLEETKSGLLSEFLGSQSLRDTIVHFHCVRAKPIQVSNQNNTNISITQITKDNVTLSAGGNPGETHKFYVRGHWSELLAMEFIVFGTEPAKWSKDNTLTDVGAVIERGTPLSMSMYSKNLFNESRSLLLGLLRKVIQSNPSLQPTASSGGG